MQFGAAYIRVSTDNQDEYSPEAQRRLIFDYAEKHDIRIRSEHIFEDIGISGTSARKRASFQDMIALAKSREHPIDVILVWKFSRFARNQEESILYKSLLKRSHVSVISVSEPIIDGPFGSLIERILEWMDEYYSIRLSGEVHRGMMQKALNGGYNGSLPYGYVMGSDHVPVIVSDQARIVQLIFDLYVHQHESISNITLQLNAAGCRTAKGNRFERRVVQYILSNPFYTGKIRWNYTPDTRGRRTNHDIVIRDGRHEAIIASDIFDAAQIRLSHSYETFHAAKRSIPTGAARHWLSGILKCPHCGSSLSFCNGTKHKYFQCWKYNKGICSKSNYIPMKKAEYYVIEGLKQMLLSDSLRYEKIPAYTWDVDTAFLQACLQDLQKKEERIRLAYIDGADTLEEYKSNKITLAKQKSDIEKQLNRSKSKPETSNTGVPLLEDVETVIHIMESDPDHTRKGDAIRSVCKKIIYDKENDAILFDLYTIE